MKLNLLSISIIGLALSASSAFATTYTYSTTGCFSDMSILSGPGTVASACTADGSTSTFQDGATASSVLTYTNQGTTTQVGYGTIDLGTFQVTDTGNNPGSVWMGDFSVLVTFTAPPSTAGGPFTALVSGNMNGTASGNTISFNPAVLDFGDGNPNDAFSLTISPNPVQVNQAGGPVTLTGTIGPVPEPMSVGLLGAGLAGLGMLRLRKARKA